MTIEAHKTAGSQAVAGASRLHAGQRFCAYFWHLETTRAGSPMPNTKWIFDGKLHHRWPEEPSS